MNISATLRQLGFSKKEAIVYIATLELGMAPVSVVARKSRLERSTTFEVLKKLSGKGVADYFLKKRTRYYSVLSPVKLLERFKSHVEELETALPEMLARTNAIVGKPKITFYEGKEDLKRLYLDALTSKGEILNYFQPETTIAYFSWDWLRRNMVEKLLGKKHSVRVIMPDTPMSRRFLQQRETPLRKQKIAASDLIFKTEVGIYDDKVMIFSFDEDFAMLIESRDVADTQRALFDLAWESASLKKVSS